MVAPLTRVLLIGMSFWLVGAGPLFSEAVHAFEEAGDANTATDPCPGCPDEDDGDPCSPLCTDCVCSLGVARVLPGAPAEVPEARGQPLVTGVELPSPGDSAPSPTLDGLERPPRR